MGLQRVRHDWNDLTHTQHNIFLTRRLQHYFCHYGLYFTSRKGREVTLETEHHSLAWTLQASCRAYGKEKSLFWASAANNSAATHCFWASTWAKKRLDCKMPKSRSWWDILTVTNNCKEHVKDDRDRRGLKVARADSLYIRKWKDMEQILELNTSSMCSKLYT